VFESGGFGYGHAKQALFEILLDKFALARSQFDKLMDEPQQMDLVLEQGAQKAQEIAEDVLSRVRSRLGFFC
jgi:tryptophanyl-tRNA synthetase